jgi:hypothetical protein
MASNASERNMSNESYDKERAILDDIERDIRSGGNTDWYSKLTELLENSSKTWEEKTRRGYLTSTEISELIQREFYIKKLIASESSGRS